MADFVKRLGANQRELYHFFSASRTSVVDTAKGSTLSGRIGGLMSSYGTKDGEPQNSHFCATLSGANTLIAWQLLHLTVRRSDCQPRASPGKLRSAVTRSCSLTITPCGLTCMGEVVPQAGHTSACLAAFHSALAPQAGQGNLCWLIRSGMAGQTTKNPSFPRRRESRR